jgi:hypothetical protein
MVIGNAVRQSTHQVRVGVASIHVTEWGDGQPILLLHGNPDNGMMWDGVAARLGTRFRCVAPDLPGVSVIRKCQTVTSLRLRDSHGSSSSS